MPGSAGPSRELVVVDDGSRDPAAIAAVAAVADAVLICHPQGHRPCAGAQCRRGRDVGPAARVPRFRCPADPDWLAGLIGHFTDPRVAAVAPRVSVPAGGGAVSAYEAARSPLDLGDEPGLAGPGRRLGFVPATALVVRRSAFDAVGRFDARLTVGEDVDLVWRLSEASWTVRYEPSVVVEHPARRRPRAWLGQRLAYGSSAGALARRHPDAMRHLVIPRWAVTPWLLAAAGRPRAALLAAVAGTGLVAARLPPAPDAGMQLLRFVAGAQLRIGIQVLDAGWRAYPPLVAGAAVARPQLRRSLAVGARHLSRRRLDQSDGRGSIRSGSAPYAPQTTCPTQPGCGSAACAPGPRARSCRSW